MSELESVKEKNGEYGREFYLRNPDIFVEQYFNVKLLWYQKNLVERNGKKCKTV